MKNIIMAALAVLVLGTGAGHATILLDTIGGDAYGPPALGYPFQNVGDTPASLAIGVGFSAGTSTEINGILAYIYPAGSPASFTLGLMQADSSGAPAGSALYTTDILFADATQPVKLSDLHWSIDAGSNYFLVAIAEFGSQNSWQASSQQTGQVAAAGYPFTSWGVFDDSALPAAIISTENIPDVSGVPLHPSTWPMMALGVVLFGWVASRRKQAAI